MRILQFKYFSKDDYSDIKRLAWSRIYEYPFVINTIKDLCLDNPSIHNTGCGGGEIHLQFARELEQYGIIFNTDNDSRKRKYLPNNFMKYDLTEKCNYKSDIVLCVSTLEHLSDQVLVLKNLLEATKDGGYLIVTLDSPPVDLLKIEEFLGAKCEGVEKKLNQYNSRIPNTAFIDELNVVKLVIQK